LSFSCGVRIFREIQSDYPEFNAKQVVYRVLRNYQVYGDRNREREKLPS
jgi:hypothetical protein